MQLNRYGIMTDRLEYRHHHNKPGLFSRIITKNVFIYVDFRDNNSDSIYFRIDKSDRNWRVNRLIKNELKMLNYFKIFDEDYLSQPFITTFGSFNDEYYNITNDGFCDYCGKDFQDDGQFCSANCIQSYREKDMETCVACGKKIYDKVVRHHISYFPEEIVCVDVNCHASIHLANQYQHLAPPKGHAKIFYAEKKAEIKRNKIIRQGEKERKIKEDKINKRCKKLDRKYTFRQDRKYTSHYGDPLYKGYFL